MDSYIMEKEKSLHELYEYLPDYFNIKSLIILSLDITVNVHAQHFSHYALTIEE